MVEILFLEKEMVECLFRNQVIVGSSPAAVTFFRLNVVIWAVSGPKFCERTGRHLCDIDY